MISIAEDKCVGCATCKKVCIANIIVIVDKKAQLKTGREHDCLHCGHCQSICPKDAIEMPEAMGTASPAKQELSFESLSHLAESNRSIRNFTPELVAKEKLTAMIRTLDYTASSKNLQPISWIVVSGKEKVAEVSNLACAYLEEKQKFGFLLKAIAKGVNPITVNASHLLIAVADKNIPTAFGDAMIKTSLARLLLHSDGIGSCYLGFLEAFCQDSPALQAHFGLSSEEKVLSIMAFGYNDNEVYTKVPGRKKSPVRFLE